MFAGRIWRDDSLDPTFCQPVPQAPCIIGAIGHQSARQTDCRQELVGDGEIMAIAGRDQK